MNSLHDNAFGHYKVVTRIDGKHGCTVQKCYSALDAKQTANKARLSGKEAEVSVQTADGWETVEE